jgi:hypothetical protein
MKTLQRAAAFALAFVAAFAPIEIGMRRAEAGDTSGNNLLGTGVRFIPQSTAPAACLPGGTPHHGHRDCIWLDIADNTIKQHKTDGTDTAIGSGGALTPPLIGTLSGSSLPSSTWTWLQNDVGNMFKFDPNDGVGGVRFHVAVSAKANDVGARNDNVWSEGWNLGSNGVIDVTKGFLGWRMEDHYWNGFQYQSEYYLSAGPPAAVGPGYRPIAVNTSDSDPLGTVLLLNAHQILLGGGQGPSAGRVQLYVTDDTAAMQSPDTSRIVFVTNDQIAMSGPDNISGTATIKWYDADPVRWPHVIMRVGGGIIPQFDGASTLGFYRDTGDKQRWLNVPAYMGQFLKETQTTCDSDHIGGVQSVFNALAPAASHFSVCEFNGSVPEWHRMATTGDLGNFTFSGNTATTSGSPMQLTSDGTDFVYIQSGGGVGFSTLKAGIIVATRGAGGNDGVSDVLDGSGAIGLRVRGGSGGNATINFSDASGSTEATITHSGAATWTVSTQSTTGTTTVTSAGSGTTLHADTTSTGGVGSTAYTTADVIKALKGVGILAQ